MRYVMPRRKQNKLFHTTKKMRKVNVQTARGGIRL